jgi:hypothetical protein
MKTFDEWRRDEQDQDSQVAKYFTLVLVILAVLAGLLA